MKIIKQGVIPESQPVQVECRNCHAVIEFHPMEAQRVSDQREGDFYQIDCPCCHKEIIKSVR